MSAEAPGGEVPALLPSSSAAPPASPPNSPPQSPPNSPPTSPLSPSARGLLSWRGQWDPGWSHIASFRGAPEGPDGDSCVVFRYCQKTGQSELVTCALHYDHWSMLVSQHWVEDMYQWHTVVPVSLDESGGGRREFLMLLHQVTPERAGFFVLLEIRAGEAWYMAELPVYIFWTHLVPFKNAGNPFVLCYQQSTGHCVLLQLECNGPEDLSVVPRGTARFTAGWTDICLKAATKASMKPLKKQRFFCYSSVTGESGYETVLLREDGGIDDSSGDPPQLQKPGRVARGRMMVPFCIGSRSCCHFYKPQGDASRWFIETPGPKLNRAVSAEIELLHKRIQSVPHPWTYVGALAPHRPDRGFVFCYNVDTGAVWICGVRIEDAGPDGSDRFVCCRNSPKHLDALPIPRYPGPQRGSGKPRLSFCPAPLPSRQSSCIPPPQSPALPPKRLDTSVAATPGPSPLESGFPAVPQTPGSGEGTNRRETKDDVPITLPVPVGTMGDARSAPVTAPSDPRPSGRYGSPEQARAAVARMAAAADDDPDDDDSTVDQWQPENAEEQELVRILRELRRAPFHGGPKYCRRALARLKRREPLPTEEDTLATIAMLHPQPPRGRSRPVWKHICHCRPEIPPPPPSSHAAAVEELVARKVFSAVHAPRLTKEAQERSAGKLARGRRLFRPMSEVAVREATELRLGGEELLGVSSSPKTPDRKEGKTKVITIPAGTRGVVIGCDEATGLHTVACDAGQGQLAPARVDGHVLELVTESGFIKARHSELAALRDRVERQERAEKSLRPRPPRLTRERMDSSVRRLYETNRRLLASRAEERSRQFLAVVSPSQHKTTCARVAERLYESPREKHREAIEKARKKFACDMRRRKADPTQQAHTIERLYSKPHAERGSKEAKLKQKYMDKDLSPSRKRNDAEWQGTLERLYVVRSPA
eukprot:TRINITY_DN74_c0_g1_i1.p1 TRINITY_DN74_c0_g1~~TRINITY_DN74_c0_g1_i1.p1  ORF type:complete len:958 (+),score=219.01 TRINITY_DN74_c0_g1_i1:71-2875(+)